MAWKCVSDRFDRNAGVYESVQDFSDMCHEVFGRRPELTEGQDKNGAVVLSDGEVVLRKLPAQYCDGGPRNPGCEPDGSNCKKCHGRGFVWRTVGKTQVASPCTRCGGS